MARRVKPSPQAEVTFQDPLEEEKSHRDDPQNISRLLMQRIQALTGLSVKQIAAMMVCSSANVNHIMKSAPSGSSLKILATFADACDCELIVSFRRRAR
jgi:hypothetical protein